VIALVNELMAGSDVEAIIAKMNDEYGLVHFDEEDALRIRNWIGK